MSSQTQSMASRIPPQHHIKRGTITAACEACLPGAAILTGVATLSATCMCLKVLDVGFRVTEHGPTVRDTFCNAGTKTPRLGHVYDDVCLELHGA